MEFKINDIVQTYCGMIGIVCNEEVGHINVYFPYVDSDVALKYSNTHYGYDPVIPWCRYAYHLSGNYIGWIDILEDLDMDVIDKNYPFNIKRNLGNLDFKSAYDEGEYMRQPYYSYWPTTSETGMVYTPIFKFIPSRVGAKARYLVTILKSWRSKKTLDALYISNGELRMESKFTKLTNSFKQTIKKINISDWKLCTILNHRAGNT